RSFYRLWVPYWVPRPVSGAAYSGRAAARSSRPVQVAQVDGGLWVVSGSFGQPQLDQVEFAGPGWPRPRRDPRTDEVPGKFLVEIPGKFCRNFPLSYALPATDRSATRSKPKADPADPLIRSIRGRGPDPHWRAAA